MQLYRADSVGPRYYLDLFGADHFTPYEGSGAPEPVVARVTTDFLDRYLAGQHSAAAAMRRVGHVSGVAALATGAACPGGTGAETRFSPRRRGAGPVTRRATDPGGRGFAHPTKLCAGNSMVRTCAK